MNAEDQILKATIPRGEENAALKSRVLEHHYKHYF